NLQSDQNVLVTARSADGQWLEIYIGQVGAESGWARASSLQLKAAPDSLPIAACTPAATAGPGPATLEPPASGPSLLPSVGPSLAPSLVPSVAPSVTGVPATVAPSAGATPTPTPAPTKTPKPTATPAPTPTAPTGPTLTAFTLNPYPGYWYIVEDPPGSGQYPIYQVGCTIGNWTVGFYIEAQDPDGIASMTLYYQPQGVNDPIQQAMGEEGPGEYYTEIVTEDGWSLGDIDYWITAIDGVGDSTTFNGPSNKQIVYTVCND
ncbi:MAG TPA: hypothetical protein VFI15_01350, partial [Candidatus Limnocylindrales bacterium]|nr:hypothetical protein [Candidatus Limnocylindrales bacterium]